MPPWIKTLKESGYLFHLTFLLLSSPELAISRVSERVKMGGHFVAENIIKRRFEAGLENFFKLYIPLADSWQMYENSEIANPLSIAAKIDNNLIIYNKTIWTKLLEKYNDK